MKMKKLNACIGATKQLFFAWPNVITIQAVCLNAGEIKMFATKVSFLKKYSAQKSSKIEKKICKRYFKSVHAMKIVQMDATATVLIGVVPKMKLENVP